LFGVQSVPIDGNPTICPASSATSPDEKLVAVLPPIVVRMPKWSPAFALTRTSWTEIVLLTAEGVFVGDSATRRKTPPPWGRHTCTDAVFVPANEVPTRTSNCLITLSNGTT